MWRDNLVYVIKQGSVDISVWQEYYIRFQPLSIICHRRKKMQYVFSTVASSTSVTRRALAEISIASMSQIPTH